MGSVTNRIKEIKQPKGGYISPKLFTKIEYDDGQILSETENIHSSIVGMAVEYLTRYSILAADDIKKMNSCQNDKNEILLKLFNYQSKAFKTSIQGALNAEAKGFIDKSVTNSLLVLNLGDDSIINACKLVSFDVWYRNPKAALLSKSYKDINPNENTINNIRILVQRGFNLLNHCSNIKFGFDFYPEIKNKSAIIKNQIGQRECGGYSIIVNSGDGDFLADDTLWDFKVSKSAITNKNTLQVLMYYIMGQHSGKQEFKNISKLGIFNPRLNVAHTINVSAIPSDVIKSVEKDVLCYGLKGDADDKKLDSLIKYLKSMS